VNVLDLFSGIGGFSLGLERTGGFRTVAFCEIEPYCRAVLKKHWPNVPCYEDVRTLTAERLRADGISVDAICGGFPCQDISTAGKGAGIEGERSGLWKEYARIIGEVRPRYVIVENVAALLGRGLSRVLGDLAEIGYDAEWHCIPASYVGAPHRRDRLWIVAYSQSKRYTERGEERDFPEEDGRQDGQMRSIFSGAGQQSADMADPRYSRIHEQRKSFDACEGLRFGRGIQPNGIPRKQEYESETLADPTSKRPSGQRESGIQCSPTPRLDWQADQLIAERFGSQWRTEPNVGGRFDGFPMWLYRHCGRGMSYAESYRSVKELRDVWNNDVAETLWENIGGFGRIQKAEILFYFVRELKKKGRKARIDVEGKKVCEEVLRIVWGAEKPSRSSLRPEPSEQQSGQSTDALQMVSQLSSRNGKANWSICSWEDGIPRVANGVPSRVDRLKGLGNAVVPQIPEIIGRVILKSEGIA
jgi:DNA-cytosine methyltransferase